MKKMEILQFRMVKWISVCLLMLGVLACESQTKELILLHTNDSHGSIVAVDSVGGMAERAAFIRKVREEAPGVLLVDAGDINTGQAVSNMFDAKPDIESYNYMGYDAVTMGNHEFDKPVAVLLQQMKWANFPFLTTNISYRGKTLGQGYLIKNINGIKVGLLGITTKNSENISIYANEVVFQNEVESARQGIQDLKKQKVDIIIGLVHLGFTETTPDFITSTKLAEQVEGFDILVDGHSHSYIEEPVKVKNTWIVTANQSGRYVGEGKVKVKRGKMTDFKWKPVMIKGYQPDSTLFFQLRPFIDSANQDLQTVIGKAMQMYALYKEGRNIARYEESALGDLVADALVWKARENLGMHVDFGLTNSGGIRESLPAGEITKGDVLAVLPFANTLEIVEIKGSDVKRLFGFIATVVPGNGAFAQVSKDVKVVYDREARQVKSVLIHGKPVEDSTVYYMATGDYVASGKDGYDAGLSKQLKKESTSRLMSEVVMEYICMKGKITPQTDGRIQIIR